MSTKRKTKVDVLVTGTAAAPIRLDIGCGKNKREGFIGVDQFAIPGVDVVMSVVARQVFASRDGNLPTEEFIPWPWADNTVEEVNCTHFLEHLTNLGGKWERVWFFNELYRVMKPGAKCNLVLPHWASNRYYGDPTHCEPFSEMGFYYLSRTWRLQETPAVDISFNPNGYSCDFECTWGYSLHASIMSRNSEYQQFAIQNYKEAAQDIIATLIAKK